MKLFEKMRSVVGVVLMLAVGFGLMLFAACGSDDDPVVVDPKEKFLGSYNITGATFVNSNTFTIPVSDTVCAPVPFGPGANDVGGPSALAFVYAGLFNPPAPACDPIASAAIELRTDETSWLSCALDASIAPVQQGSWSLDETDATNTKISITVAPPIAVTTLTVLIENVTISGSTLTGRATNFPLPPDACKAVDATNLGFFEIDLTFTKLP